MGISRISMSQYLANLCHTTCTGPHTMLGLSVGLPAGLALGPPAPLGRHARRACRPPTSRWPSTRRRSPPSGAFHRSASIWTQRRSISAVWGYSSLSIMFLLMERSISWWTSASSHVWQKVARFWRALPSSSSSSEIAWKASGGRISSSGNWCDGRHGQQVPVGVDRVGVSLPRGLPLVQRHRGPPVGSVQRCDPPYRPTRARGRPNGRSVARPIGCAGRRPAPVPR